MNSPSIITSPNQNDLRSSGISGLNSPKTTVSHTSTNFNQNGATYHQ